MNVFIEKNFRTPIRFLGAIKNKFQKRFGNLLVLKTKYENYDLYYSKGTSIVERFLREGAYEKSSIDCITKYLSKIQNHKCFVDIGANIGMVSLAILNRVDNVTVYSFEPGPHQLNLLKKNIAKNKLKDKVKIYSEALCNKQGESSFSVHSHEDVSGDGFIDTNRAGKTEIIKVKTDTFDNWWKNQGMPEIDFIKIDTEGAEYLILQGMAEFLKNYSPAMLIEIHPQNIKNYNHNIDDLIKLIKELNYKIYNNKNEVIDNSVLDILNSQNGGEYLLIREI